MVSTQAPIGVHRLIVALYGVLSAAALGRSSYQIIAKFEDAPLAYSLSAVAAVVYVIATWAVAMSARGSLRGLALATVSFELLGVVGIGVVSLVWPSLFPDATVWSHFGAGYLFIPLALPIAGLWWLRVSGRS